jgi:hypothetical protein
VPWFDEPQITSVLKRLLRLTPCPLIRADGAWRLARWSCQRTEAGFFRESLRHGGDTFPGTVSMENRQLGVGGTETFPPPLSPACQQNGGFRRTPRHPATPRSPPAPSRGCGTSLVDPSLSTLSGMASCKTPDQDGRRCAAMPPSPNPSMERSIKSGWTGIGLMPLSPPAR